MLLVSGINNGISVTGLVLVCVGPMSHRAPFLVVFVAVMLIPAGAVQNQAQPVTNAQSADHLFDYDSKQPLDIDDKIIEETPDAVIHDISYASPKGGRVPAY